jgi:hypothetical protein
LSSDKDGEGLLADLFASDGESIHPVTNAA